MQFYILGTAMNTYTGDTITFNSSKVELTIESGTGRYTGFSFETNTSEMKYGYGITTYGDYFWVSSTSGNEVASKFWKNGNYANYLFSPGDETNNPFFFARGITTDGTYLWVVSTLEDEVYKYWTNGTYTGKHFDTLASGNGDPTCLTNDGTYFWITDYHDDDVYKYWMNGTFISDFDVGDGTPAGAENAKGITYHNNYLWITDVVDDEVYKFWTNGTYTGEHFDTAISGNEDPTDITTDGTYFWIIDQDNEKVYQYIY
jgi:hypothetical protein